MRARVARRASVRVNILKSLGYTALLWAVCFALLPVGIYQAEAAAGWQHTRFPADGFRPSAVLVFLGGALIGLWSGYVLVAFGDGTPMPLEAPRHFVVAGPYRWVRNPMATMGILQGIAVGVFLGSSLVVVYALMGGLVWHCVLRPWEEADLRQRFGESYERYRREVPCWRPRLRPYPSLVQQRPGK